MPHHPVVHTALAAPTQRHDRQGAPPALVDASEALCTCTSPGCKCKVLTTTGVCSLCSSGNHTHV
ncbi:hypothetical protein Q5752_002417 [Cryptotrichosporon argae]